MTMLLETMAPHAAVSEYEIPRDKVEQPATQAISISPRGSQVLALLNHVFDSIRDANRPRNSAP